MFAGNLACIYLIAITSSIYFAQRLQSTIHICLPYIFILVRIINIYMVSWQIFLWCRWLTMNKTFNMSGLTWFVRLSNIFFMKFMLKEATTISLMLHLQFSLELKLASAVVLYLSINQLSELCEIDCW